VSRQSDVLVVGAGPTGLTLALQAHDHGADVRVVERRPDPFRQSRAMILHPRTLETLRPLGVTEQLLDRADIAPRAELHLGRSTVTAQLAELDLPDTAFPHLTMLRQMDVEEVLAAALRSRKIEVERGTELVDALSEPDEAGLVRGTLRTDAGLEDAACRFVAGCDGPGSTVREVAGIAWRGGPYREEVVLADVELDESLTPGVLHVVAGREGLVFVFALGEGATWRVLATRRRRSGEEPQGQPGQPGRPVPVVEVQRLLDVAGLGASVTELRWSAQVPLQHRVAQSYRSGRLFLAGDAAHSHSPAAAQGMNTGIVDAVNLGWKLAFASAGVDSGGGSDVLASYEQERRAVARQVLALTHLVFLAEASTSPLPALLRGRLAPLAAPLLPLVLRQRRPMAAVVRMLSQRWVRYRHSPLSVDGTPAHRGWPRPGDRLPDADVVHRGRTVRLHALTARPGVHILLQRDAADLDLRRLGPHVCLHRITSSPGPGMAAVRPDGHVGFRCGHADPAQLGSWLDLVGARR
jgi:2-polyprenyl-6-methoxyphenol hydroxylase-like FAD-dependent oxidoreductase